MMLLLQAPAGMLHASVAARHAPMRAVRSPMMVAAEPLAASYEQLPPDMPLSGLQGKAMFVEASDIPSKKQVRDVVPAHCFTRNTAKSMMYAVISVLQSAACVWAGTLIPLKAAFAPLWLAYGAVTGTVFTGMWVVAHECGHGAFSDNRFIQVRLACGGPAAPPAKHAPRPNRARAVPLC